MAVTKMARPIMVTRTISEVIEEAKANVMLKGKCNVTTAKIMGILPMSARIQGYLKGEQQALVPPMQGLNAYARILYQCNIMSQFQFQ